MLNNSRVATRLPAQDLDRARAFYSDKLGLEPIDERPGGRPAWAPYRERHRRHRGNYRSVGVGERAAWFRDSEGNMLGIGQPVR